jgi:spore coat polysaccharide biosynthesis predicted glycosyltransferase SpsG
MINLYLNCDLAIGTLSVTAYERLILNIPQICLKIVENQLIQQLDKFNIVTIDNLLDKILDYNKIINDYIEIIFH